MAKIIAPNQQYNGISASIQFENGIGETNNPHLIAWFKSNGYKVEETQKEDLQQTLLQDEILTTDKVETINQEPKTTTTTKK